MMAWLQLAPTSASSLLSYRRLKATVRADVKLAMPDVDIEDMASWYSLMFSLVACTSSALSLDSSVLKQGTSGTGFSEKVYTAK